MISRTRNISIKSWYKEERKGSREQRLHRNPVWVLWTTLLAVHIRPRKDGCMCNANSVISKASNAPLYCCRYYVQSCSAYQESRKDINLKARELPERRNDEIQPFWGYIGVKALKALPLLLCSTLSARTPKSQ